MTNYVPLGVLKISIAQIMESYSPEIFSKNCLKAIKGQSKSTLAPPIRSQEHPPTGCSSQCVKSNMLIREP